MLKLIFNKDIGDKWLFILPLLLSTFGLLMIFNASSVAALKDFSDKFYYFKHQLAWLAIGIVLFLTFSIFDYRLLKKFAFLAFFFELNFIDNRSFSFCRKADLWRKKMA